MARSVTAFDMRHDRVPSNLCLLTASDVPSKCSVSHPKQREPDLQQVEFAEGMARSVAAQDAHNLFKGRDQRLRTHYNIMLEQHVADKRASVDSLRRSVLC